MNLVTETIARSVLAIAKRQCHSCFSQPELPTKTNTYTILPNLYYWLIYYFAFPTCSPRRRIPPKRHYSPHWPKPHATMHDHSRFHRAHLTNAKHHVHQPRPLFGAKAWVAWKCLSSWKLNIDTRTAMYREAHRLSLPQAAVKCRSRRVFLVQAV
jgi:hypothetical protein